MSAENGTTDRMLTLDDLTVIDRCLKAHPGYGLAGLRSVRIVADKIELVIKELEAIAETDAKGVILVSLDDGWPDETAKTV